MLTPSTRMGVRDVPIEEYAEDETGLGVESYARALTAFVQRTETPMTIGIQGDWGSGKTSLMNLMRRSLTSDDKTARIIWINTWAYSRMVSEDALPGAIVSGILAQFKSARRKDAVAGFLSIIGKFGARAVDQATAGVAGAEALLDQITQRAEGLDALRKQLEQLVQEEVGQTSGRVVVFIDDLDRILPLRAVEILEALKLFLDVPGCVFVLACDYDVVQSGLQQKFGISHDALAGRSFFDKIIQVPFQMPVPSSDRQVRYLTALLDNVGAKMRRDPGGTIKAGGVCQLLEILRATQQTNPRTMKRLVNILSLLRIILDSEEVTWDDAFEDRDLAVFALIALQQWEPAIHAWLSRTGTSPEDLDAGEIPAIQRRLRTLDPSEREERLNRINAAAALVMDLVSEVIRADLSRADHAGDEAAMFQRFVSIADVASVGSDTAAEPATNAGRYFIDKVQPPLDTLAQRIMAAAATVAKKQERDHKKHLTTAIRLDSLDTWYLVRADDGARLWFAKLDHPSYSQQVRRVMDRHGYTGRNVLTEAKMRGGREGLCFELDPDQSDAAAAVCRDLLSTRWWETT